MLDWTTAAILSSAIIGAASIMDSHLLSRRLPSLGTFLLPASPVFFALGLLLLYIFPLPENLPWHIVPLTIVAGIMRGVAILTMLYHLKKQEVSRVIPIIYSYPVFVAVIAVPVLGETLSHLQWLAIIIVVMGAMVVSAGKGPVSSQGWLGRTTFYLFLTGLLFAGADVITKYVLSYISFWHGYAFAAFCIGTVFFLFSIRPQTIRELRDMKQKKLALGMLFANEIIAPLAVILSYWAMQNGPISLVSTIVGSRPVFVAIYSLILSRILPGFLMKFPSMKVFMVRLAAIIMIFGGISIIYLT